MSKISVIMPIYNAEKTLERAINSAINQSFKDEYEIILINDGSNDNSEEICEKYANKYNFIKYKKIQNSGVSVARNIGLEMTKSKYVMFLDGDDYYEANALKDMYDYIENNNVDLIISGYNRINEQKHTRIEKKVENCIYTKETFNTIIEKAQKQNLLNQIWNKIFKVDIIQKNKIRFDVECSLGEDYKFVLQYIKSIRKIMSIENKIYNYINSTSGLNMVYRRERMKINLENMKELEVLYKDNNYDMKYINKKYVKTYLSGIKNICNNPSKKERKQGLINFSQDISIYNKLSLLKNESMGILEKFLIKLLLTKRIYILKLIGEMLNVYEFWYKKIKLGY